MRGFITVAVLIIVLSFFGKLAREKEKKIDISEGKFLIKLSFGFFWLGLITVGIMSMGMADLRSKNNLSTELVIIFILAILLSVMLMICTWPGVWDILVDQDNITVRSCVILKKHFRFSEITHCIEKMDGWNIYIYDQKKKAFFVKRLKTGAGLFMARIEAAEIPVKKTKCILKL